jgi:repressor of nif and glnA expression
MNTLDPRVGPALLQILADSGQPLGASRLARELALQGVELQARMVRYHLDRLDQRGWTENLGRAGRRITARGLEELARAFVPERIHLASARLDELAFRMDLDPLRKRGRLVLNLTGLPVDAFRASTDLMREVLLAGLGLPQRVAIGLEGEALGGRVVPYGSILVGTVCSVTLSGALRAAGIPVLARFAGLLTVAGGQPRAFAHLIHYDGSTLDPAQLFIKARLTRVLETVRRGEGNLLAGFREIPAVALPEAERIIGLLDRMGLGHALALGRPGRPLLGVPVPPGRAGLVVAAGLNTVAVLEEAGVRTDPQAAAALHPAEDLLRPSELDRRVATSRRLHQRLAALMENPPVDREYTHAE